MAKPFVYPAGHEWRTIIAHSVPGTMLWVPMHDPKAGTDHIVFAVREESQIIKSLPAMKSGSVVLEWRLGVMEMETEGGAVVAFAEVMLKTPGGVSEANVNVLHLDPDMIRAIRAENAIVLAFFGDSGSIERTIMFMGDHSKTFRSVIEVALGVFEREPWTDADYDEVKAHLESTMTVDQIWKRLGRK